MKHLRFCRCRITRCDCTIIINSSYYSTVVYGNGVTSVFCFYEVISLSFNKNIVPEY